jgi:ankyrin repeat protein
VVEGYPLIVHYLLCRGAELESLDNEQRTPLMWAACYGYYNICVYLIARGANIQRVDSRGRTALHWAAVNGFVNCVKLLHDKVCSQY